MQNPNHIYINATNNPIISWTRDTKAMNGLHLVYKVYQLYSKGMAFILLPTSTALLMRSVLTSLSPSTWTPMLLMILKIDLTLDTMTWGHGDRMLLMISKIDSTLDTMTWALTWLSPRYGDQEPPHLFSKSRELYLAPEMDTIEILHTNMITITTAYLILPFFYTGKIFGE